jgi:hypothetical protein
MVAALEQASGTAVPAGVDVVPMRFTKSASGRKRPLRRGRPPKGDDKYLPVSIRLSPKVVAWAKKEAQRRAVGYQT